MSASKVFPTYKNGLKPFFSPREQLILNAVQRQMNSLGYEVPLTSLSEVVRLVTEQKFYNVPFSEYVPVRVGQGAFSSNLLTYRSYQLAGEFEDGIVDTGGNNARLAQADAGIDSVTVQVFNWVTGIGWSVFDLEQASRSGNWDLVTEKSRSAKKLWDLGLQRVCFLGARGSNGSGGSCLGLLNQAGITTNTSIITQSISSMTSAQLKTLCQNLLAAYRLNVNATEYPSRLVVPESDYNGLASQSSPEFPIKSTLQLLEEMFQVITQKKDFKILPLAYADKAYSGFNYQIYALYNYDESSIRMDTPVSITSTIPNSVDNYNFNCVFYGQFTGVQAYRPQELMYFTY